MTDESGVVPEFLRATMEPEDYLVWVRGHAQGHGGTADPAGVPSERDDR